MRSWRSPRCMRSVVAYRKTIAPLSIGYCSLSTPTCKLTPMRAEWASNRISGARASCTKSQPAVEAWMRSISSQRWYLNGCGVGLDDELAEKWLQKAADLGHPEAQIALSEMLHRGLSRGGQRSWQAYLLAEFALARLPETGSVTHAGIISPRARRGAAVRRGSGVRAQGAANDARRGENDGSRRDQIPSVCIRRLAHSQPAAIAPRLIGD